jgi:IS5 family transposase
MSFLFAEAQYRLQESALLKLSQMLDWNKIGQELGDMGRSGYGPEGYRPIQLFKALILQAWHSLSDPGLEEALKVRLDFMMFTGFEGKVPDETTFCRFRNLLVKQDLWEKLLQSINDQLSGKGFQVSPASGAIVDATIIRSAARPGKEMEGIVIDRQEETSTVSVKDVVKQSADSDAAWLKKNSKSYFGYKGFAVVDACQGFIQRVYVAPANVSEVRSLQIVLGKIKTRRAYGDKGYASQENRDLLRTQDIRDGLMYKAARGHPLTHWQKVFNKLVSQKRYLVEQAFGTLKRRFQFERASYFTVAKVHGQMTLKAIAFNLLKALRQYQTA